MATSGNGNGRRDRRLKSWKEIAAFFGADERTVKRWEEKRGLPVRRIPGGARPTVYADVSELEVWLRGEKGVAKAVQPVAAPAAAAPPRRLGFAAWIVLAALLAAGALAAGLWGLGPSGGAEAARHQPPPRAVDHYLAGLYHWERRTPESLNRALVLFGRAIAEDPVYAEAHAGRANAYLLLREYAGMADEEAYPMARQAAQRALSLDDRLPEAHVALAFVTFFWDRDFDRGLRSFERAIALDPASPRAHHWHATALYHAGRIDRAVAEIEEARRLDPDSRSILADKGMILYFAGRKAEAVALLRQLAQSEPDFLSPPRYLAIIALAEGAPQAYLAHARAAARLAGDRDRLATLDAAERGFSEGGREGMLRAMLAAQRRLHEAGRESAYALAGTHALLGDRPAALRELDAAARSGDRAIVSVRVDPLLRSLHDDPAFRRIAARMGTPAR